MQCGLSSAQLSPIETTIVLENLLLFVFWLIIVSFQSAIKLPVRKCIEYVIHFISLINLLEVFSNMNKTFPEKNASNQ